jgi:hypothetical protein
VGRGSHREADVNDLLPNIKDPNGDFIQAIKHLGEWSLIGNSAAELANDSYCQIVPVNGAIANVYTDTGSYIGGFLCSSWNTLTPNTIYWGLSPV